MKLCKKKKIIIWSQEFITPETVDKPESDAIKSKLVYVGVQSSNCMLWPRINICDARLVHIECRASLYPSLKCVETSCSCSWVHYFVYFRFTNSNVNICPGNREDDVFHVSRLSSRILDRYKDLQVLLVLSWFLSWFCVLALKRLNRFLESIEVWTYGDL